MQEEMMGYVKARAGVLLPEGALGGGLSEPGTGGLAGLHRPWASGLLQSHSLPLPLLSTCLSSA